MLLAPSSKLPTDDDAITESDVLAGEVQMQRTEGSPQSNGFATEGVEGCDRLGVRDQANRKARRQTSPRVLKHGDQTIELFAGIGGFRRAADSLGLKTVWANDVSALACKVYRDRFGEGELREGDIHALSEGIAPHDLLTAGFPCQPFSSAGKKEGVRDPRGTLFQAIIDVLEKHHPSFFVLENVKRLLTMENGFHFATILSSLSDLDYQIEWRLLNAMELGLPQNRQRVFIVGVHSRCCSKSPSIRLVPAADLETLRPEVLDAIGDPACWKEIGKHGVRFPNWGVATDGRFVAADLERFSAAAPDVKLREVLQDDVSADFDFTETTLQWISANTPVNRFVQGVEILSNQGGGARMGYTIFGVNGVAPTLTSTTSRHYERYKIGNRYRRLTNVEYARIQGFQDNHCQAASVYEQYALIGNAVPPPMAGWVMGRLSLTGLRPEDVAVKGQRDLFSYVEREAYDEQAHEGATPQGGGGKAPRHRRQGKRGAVRKANGRAGKGSGQDRQRGEAAPLV
jgi:DNA (cytosine-5)-methyltransferase 1